jgi:glycosyltransferase involved in cell wall biosynthesis
MYTILLFGKLPPPYIGPAVATEVILRSALIGTYDVVHFNTSDHRGIYTLAKIDYGNIAIAIKQYISFVVASFRHRPDIVYIPCAQTTIAYLRDAPFVVMAKLFRSKVVFHLRGGYFRQWYEGASSLTKWFVRRIHRYIDAQIVLGDCLRPMYRGLIDESRVHVVPNGGDYSFSEEDGVKGNRAKVLYLANFIPTKGIIEFVNAAKMIVATRSDVDFVAAGTFQDAETESWLFEQAKSMGDRFRVFQNVAGKDKADLLLSSDIFVFPTYYKYEGHPWVLIEAMAAGLPIITTDHAAISETVVNGDNGHLVPKRDAAAVAAAIDLLLNDADLRKQMGLRSREIYSKKFTKDAFISGLSRVFDTVAKSV